MNTPRFAAQATESAPGAAAGEGALMRRAQARVGLMLRDKWRIDRLLGVGGMAAVYEGRHRNSKRGAIKILHLELSADPNARTRFLREGYTANHVAHPGAVSVLDDDVAEDGSVFLVMELLEGKSVAALAESRPKGRLRPGEALQIADQLLDVLVAAHAKGIVHRDLKPDNLFVTKEGSLKVLDFGIARMLEAPDAAKMTRSGTAMGTPAFMPPEQALGEWDRVDARSDLWAVGASLFFLLTGRFVHEAPTLNQLLLKAMTAPAPAIRSLLPELSADAAEVIDRALAFNPKDRWPSAGAMQRAVREALASSAARGEPQLELTAAASNELGSAKTVAATPGEAAGVKTVAATPGEIAGVKTVAATPGESTGVKTVVATPSEIAGARTGAPATQTTSGKRPTRTLAAVALLVALISTGGFVFLRKTESASPAPPTTTAIEVPPPAAETPTADRAPAATAEMRPSVEPAATAAKTTAAASARARPAPMSTGASRPSTSAKKIDPSLKEWK